ncbi:hypothetical protein BSKO_12682 [Bryopsis sp. KO-2023]|nr:hypothetical protein BSKO_12682 [Bryopsis sp. KO-2023]
MSSTMEDSAKRLCAPVVGKFFHTSKVGHHRLSQSFYAPSFSDDSVSLWDGVRQPKPALWRSNEVFQDSLECGLEEKTLELDAKCAYFAKNIEEVRGSRVFLYMTFAVVKSLAIRGRHNAETAYCDVVRSLIVWLNDTEASKESIEELFGLLDVGLLTVDELESLRSMKEVQANSAIASCVVRNVDPKPAGSKKRGRDDDDSGPALLVLEGGVWHEWSVPNSGWYVIAGEGGKGGDDSSRDNGGRGVTIGGSFWLGHGDRLKVLVGRKKSKLVRGGGGCCVAKITAGMSDGALLLAAGGGGESHQEHNGQDAELCDDLDNCKPLPTHPIKGRAHDGRGCGVFFGLKASAREEFLNGPCGWCDGGKVTSKKGGSGGGGFYGGAGGSRSKGGSGGTSFIDPSSENAFQMKNNGPEARVCVWNGREPRTLPDAADSQHSSASIFELGDDLDEVTSRLRT